LSASTYRCTSLSTRGEGKAFMSVSYPLNVELPHFRLHELTMTSAAVKELRGYQPNVVGAFTYRSGGLRTAYLEV